MPMYTIQSKETDEIKEIFLNISEREEFFKENPEWKQVLKAPALVSQVGSNITKTDGGWKEMLGKIKKGSGRNNTIKL